MSTLNLRLLWLLLRFLLLWLLFLLLLFGWGGFWWLTIVKLIEVLDDGFMLREFDNFVDIFTLDRSREIVLHWVESNILELFHQAFVHNELHFHFGVVHDREQVDGAWLHANALHKFLFVIAAQASFPDFEVRFKQWHLELSVVSCNQ